MGKPIMKRIYIEDRWGGSPELYAFVNIFKLKLSIYVLKRFNERSCQVIKGSIKGIPSRLSLWQTFNNDLPQKYPHVNFLLTDKQAGHYSYLENLTLPKVTTDIMEID